MDNKLFDICPNCAGEGTVQAVSTTEIRTVNKEAFEVPELLLPASAAWSSGDGDGRPHLARDRIATARTWSDGATDGVAQVARTVPGRTGAVLGWGGHRRSPGNKPVRSHDRPRMAMRSAKPPWNWCAPPPTWHCRCSSRLLADLEKKAAAQAWKRPFWPACVVHRPRASTWRSWDNWCCC
jgi:hypothetical protein